MEIVNKHEHEVASYLHACVCIIYGTMLAKLVSQIPRGPIYMELELRASCLPAVISSAGGSSSSPSSSLTSCAAPSKWKVGPDSALKQWASWHRGVQASGTGWLKRL